MFYRMPSPAALRTFEAAARLGTFKAAAAELFVTPTAVSHQIRTLESQLGVPLFVRRTRAVTLTGSGERLATAVHQAFSQILLALEDVAAAESVLTVTTTPAFATLWLVPRIARFQEKYSQYWVQLETGTTPVDLQRDRRVDIAIRYGQSDYPNLHKVPLARETFGAYASPEYLSSLSRLREAVFIETAWRQQGIEDIGWGAWLAQGGFTETVSSIQVRQFDQEHYVVQCGIAGQGLILSSSILVQDMVQRGFLVPYRPDIQLDGMQYSLLCTTDRSNSIKFRRFSEWLETEMTIAY